MRALESVSFKVKAYVVEDIAHDKPSGVYGGQNGAPIDFNNAFVAFMESAAMYLR